MGFEACSLGLIFDCVFVIPLGVITASQGIEIAGGIGTDIEGFMGITDCLLCELRIDLTECVSCQPGELIIKVSRVGTVGNLIAK